MNAKQRIEKFNELKPLYLEAYKLANKHELGEDISFKKGWVIMGKNRIQLKEFELMKNRLTERAKNPAPKLARMAIGDISMVLSELKMKLFDTNPSTLMEEFANEQVKILCNVYDIKESQAMFLVMMAINQYNTPRVEYRPMIYGSLPE